MIRHIAIIPSATWLPACQRLTQMRGRSRSLILCCVRREQVSPASRTRESALQ